MYKKPYIQLASKGMISSSGSYTKQTGPFDCKKFEKWKKFFIIISSSPKTGPNFSWAITVKSQNDLSTIIASLN